MTISSEPAPDGSRPARPLRLGLALLGLLLLAAALPAAFYAVLAVGMGHAHHLHRSLWDGVQEISLILAPLLLMASAVAALVARNRRWLIAIPVFWALLVVDLAALHFSGKWAAASHGHP